MTTTTAKLIVIGDADQNFIAIVDIKKHPLTH